ncbi:DUF2147 domain-containing protein [Mesonia aestuariivivens]|uniref:DUF2147 domain-containing protein n=1 Tax=Mesonia aestuariivivens TaxID=2796128 RepID=A0ABS6W3T0_9FLAO|nr:DUF2147 domain-containing protein [Mesonia aestuariivivens]MBW2962525.1 DUF2147 domain-containing protein [Mesonia aestuariivivens]
MKNLKTLLLFLLFPTILLSQSILDDWKIINEETGETRSIVKIYEAEDGLVYGKVIKIVNEDKRDRLCVKCEGEDKDMKIHGLVLMKHFHKDGDRYVDGTITNPDDGKVYKSKIWLDEDNPDLLNVRGYISFFYKTMQWQRL